MIVTTSYSPSHESEEQAKLLAEELGARWVKRRRESLAHLRKQYASEEIVVVTQQDIRYIKGDTSPLFFHPSVALIRIKRMLNGEQDAMIAASGARPGDTVIDCTAGLAADAIVFSHHVGEEGRVIALESELITALLIREGLRSYQSELEPLNAAMRRIQTVHIDHLEYLRRLADRSVDVVYFDPMFRQPIDDSAWITPLREVANVQSITAEAVSEACRIARRSVVLKELQNSGEFERLGFQVVSSKNSKVAYGVIRC